MTLARLFAILKGRWAAAAVMFILVLGLVAAYTYTVSRQYTAVGSVVLDIKTDPILGSVLPSIASPSYIITQIDIIQNTRVARRVVADLRLAQSPMVREQWLKATGGAGEIDAWLARSLLSGLEARPSRGSNVINIIYTSGDPRFSATVVNGFIDAYMAVGTELRTGPAKDFSRFFDENAKTLRENLEQAQSKLSEFQQKNGLVVTDERLDIETARLQTLSSQLVAMQALAAESGSRQSQATIQGDKMQEMLSSPIYSSLKAELARHESTLGQLTQRLGEAHPQVQEQRVLVAEIKEKLDAEVRRVSSGLNIANSVNQSRTAQVLAALDEQRAKVLRLRAVRDEAAVLQRDAENAQRAYDAVLARLNITSLESKGVQANVAPLEYATAPSAPSSPRVKTNIALGVVLASVLSVALALVLEFRDRRLRVTDEIEGFLHQPLVGSVPAFAIGKRVKVNAANRFSAGGKKLSFSQRKA